MQQVRNKALSESRKKMLRELNGVPEGQQLATIGKTKKIEMSAGGLLYLCYDVDLFAVDEQERTLLFALIDAIKAYEEKK